MILDAKRAVRRMHSKVSSDGGGYFCKPRISGGGGGGSTSGYGIKRPTNTEKLFNAIKAVYLRRQGRKDGELVFDVIKDRGGEHGEKNMEEAIKCVAQMLTMFKFQGSNEMFQTTETLRLEEVMKNVLLGDDYVPSSKAIKEYVEGD